MYFSDFLSLFLFCFLAKIYILPASKINQVQDVKSSVKVWGSGAFELYVLQSVWCLARRGREDVGTVGKQTLQTFLIILYWHFKHSICGQTIYMCLNLTPRFSTNAIFTLWVLSVFLLTNIELLKLFTLRPRLHDEKRMRFWKRTHDTIIKMICIFIDPGKLIKMP